MSRRTVGFLMVLVLIALMGGWALAINDGVKPSEEGNPDKLPIVGSRENLVSLLEKAEDNLPHYYSGIRLFDLKVGDIAVQEAETSSAAPSSASNASDRGTADYSGTNVQVAGVDEADLVKTDGQYIYQVNKGRVVIVKADPSQMKIAGIVDFPDEFQPLELYVDEKKMVVIGNFYPPQPELKPGPVKALPERGFIYPPYYQQQMVKALVYDHGDKANLKLVKEVEVEGNYVSSRKVDSALYLVTNRYLGYRIMGNDEIGILPAFRDSAVDSGYQTIGYEEIRYFPNFYTPNYLLVAGFNLEKPEEVAQVDAYLGAGEEIYASRDNLFVAVTSYQQNKDFLTRSWEQETWIYKFALQEGKLNYKGYGEVPGRILNQFSMDENNQYFRIATTTGDIWREDEGTSKNNLYVLDSKMELVGSLEGIAPGEQIYSVRFMGDKAYMVTFKTVDPLFVIDLKEPTKPRVLGALKIPGYSDYLHPYDENYLIGFGKDTVEVSQKDHKGQVVGSMAYYQGMKVALFDVTDVTDPRELFVELIGDRGTDSELLQNHRALLFSKEKNLLAFPVTIMEVKNKVSDREGGATQWGEFTFQGAYVYQLDPEHGFHLKGTISHLERDDYTKAGNHWYGSDGNIERILYIGDNLFTLSQDRIMAHSIEELKPLSSLSIPVQK